MPYLDPIPIKSKCLHYFCLFAFVPTQQSSCPTISSREDIKPVYVEAGVTPGTATCKEMIVFLSAIPPTLTYKGF